MYRNRVLYVLIACGLATGLLLFALQATQNATALTADDLVTIHQLQTDEAGLQFTLSVPPYRMDENGRIAVNGLEARTQQPGSPDLPYFVRYIALPPEADAVVTVAEKGVETDKVASVQPVPAATAVPDNDSSAFAYTTLNNVRWAYQPDPAIYQKNALYPTAAFALSEPMYYRDIRLVALHLYPVRYNPVTGMLSQVQQLEVSVTFTGAKWDNLRPSPAHNDVYLRGLSGLLLNEAQAKQWRSLPESVINAPATELPIGVDSYKIELNQDGIYEISYADLAAAGMNVTAVNPNTFEMMYRGQPVAYQFIGDSDNSFEAGEKIRFYGWAFDGSRAEKQYINNNVFWLWAGGTRTSINTTSNLAGSLPVVTATLASVTAEPVNYFFSTWTNKWDDFPNEPDAYYWDYTAYSAPVTKTYAITLPNPAANGPDAVYTIELMSREAPATPAPYTYTVRGYINNYPGYGEFSWRRGQNVNVAHTVPLSELVNGENTAVVVYATNTPVASPSARVYLNRVTVDYLRRLIATNDQLIFTDDQGGVHEFHVSGFSEGNSANALVWNLADRLNPVQIEMTAAHITGSGPFTYTIGSDQSAGSQYIAATTASLLNSSAFTLSQYIAPDLDPPADQAEWLAISHANFMAQTHQLAVHRGQPEFGGLITHTVNVEDVINQYGYGLPLPSAIQNYLAYALGNWTVAPGYVLLMGDATVNPRHLNCVAMCLTWDANAPNYIPTDLLFEDRFQGLIPSDHTFVTISGEDLLPDMAIGRITADYPISTTSVISKIILYDQNLRNEETWTKNTLFVADNTDNGGNFCAENQLTGAYLPDDYNQTHLCLPGSAEVPPTITETNAVRTQMSFSINNTGTLFLNYRGHGGIQFWTGDPHLLDITWTDFWANSTKPVVILSADCLDSHFAWAGAPALSETFLKLNSQIGGSAAHWSSSGLGFTSEHTVLITNLYDGMFTHEFVAAGDAANYAKLQYNALGYHESELYSFIFQGDPAMQLVLPTYELYLPIQMRN